MPGDTFPESLLPHLAKSSDAWRARGLEWQMEVRWLTASHGRGVGQTASPSLPNQLLPGPPSFQALCHQESFLLSLSGPFSWDNL